MLVFLERRLLVLESPEQQLLVLGSLDQLYQGGTPLVPVFLELVPELVLGLVLASQELVLGLVCRDMIGYKSDFNVPAPFRIAKLHAGHSVDMKEERQKRRALCVPLDGSGLKIDPHALENALAIPVLTLSPT